MQSKRRSGRIAKEIPIVLLGTDTGGKVFSEETKTVVLSRHGAGIVSRYAFAPDEVLTLRLPGSTKEAEVRLAGQMGGESGRYVYGVAFVDPTLNFWQIEFPPPESFEQASGAVPFECSICHAQQDVEQADIEEDVYSVNGSLLRFCPQCGASTPWKKADGASVSAAIAAPVKPSVVSIDVPLKRSDHAIAPPAKSWESRQFAFTSSAAPSPPPTTPPPEPAYSGSFHPPASATAGLTSYSTAALEALPTAAAEIAVADAPLPARDQREQDGEAAVIPQPSVRSLDSSGRRVNRRRHLRIRVNFNACVRHPTLADEIVECENVSKGGLCFHSRRHYSVGSLIEVAAPFSPGEAALFVPAQIKRVEALSGGQVFRYGAAYLKPA